MVQNYELYFILKPNLTPKQSHDVIENFKNLISKELFGKDVTVNEEGLRKLAYPIKKEINGFYALIKFDLDLENSSLLSKLEKTLNLEENIIRFIIVNETDFIKQSDKQNLKETEVGNHRDFNKGKKVKKSLPEFLGLRAIDYKDVEFLNQFTSPYSKIFGKHRTGTSSKFQRKISIAIKKARHMALMPFTPKHS